MSYPFRATTTFVARFAGAAIADQVGFPGSKTPDYVGVGYSLLEGVSVLTAAALLLSLASRLSAATWTIAAICVSAGPLLGYVLFRGPGLPDYDDDRGNWAEPLGVLRLVVESALLVLALTVLIAARPSRGTVQLQRPTPDFTRPASGTAGSDRHDQQRGRTVDHPPTARHVCAVRPKPKVSWPAGTNSCYVLPITVDSSPADTGPPLMVLAHRR